MAAILVPPGEIILVSEDMGRAVAMVEVPLVVEVVELELVSLSRPHSHLVADGQSLLINPLEVLQVGICIGKYIGQSKASEQKLNATGIESGIEIVTSCYAPSDLPLLV